MYLQEVSLKMHQVEMVVLLKLQSRVHILETVPLLCGKHRINLRRKTHRQEYLKSSDITAKKRYIYIQRRVRDKVPASSPGAEICQPALLPVLVELNLVPK